MSTQQPRLLFWLSTIEVWERLGFYIMRGLLVLYMTNILNFTDAKSYTVFATFTALLWLTPALGGHLGDKILGQTRSVYFGGLLFAVGYGLLAIPGMTTFYLGLSFVLFGNGFFKANIPALVGGLYKNEKDPRRAGGFTLYYMAINIGGLTGILIAGPVAKLFNYYAAFACASAGMTISLILFYFVSRHLKTGQAPSIAKLKKRFLGIISLENFTYLSSLILIVLSIFLLQHPKPSSYALEIVGAILVIYYLYSAFKQSTRSRNNMLGVLILILISIAFWTLYQQAPMSITLFTERNVNREVFNLAIPTVWFQGLNPFFIILLSPMLNEWWKRSMGTRWHLSTPGKFVLGTFLMALGFLLLGYASSQANNNSLVSPWWIVGSYGLQSLGELLVSPIALAMISAVAPRHLIGMMMGTWWLASAISNALGGVVAQWAALPEHGMSPAFSLHIYGSAFYEYGWLAMLATYLAWLLVPWLKSMMNETSDHSR